MNELIQYGIAIISILISLGALFIAALRDFILPLIFMPLLEIGVNCDECKHDAISPDGQVISQWLRFRLVNKNDIRSVVAKNCYVKLIEIRDQNNKKIKPLNPVLLNWVGFKERKNNLSKGEYHMVDLIQWRIGLHHLYPANFEIPNELMRNIHNKLGPGKYCFKLGVYGDNIQPMLRDIQIEFDINTGIQFIKEQDEKMQ